MDLKQKDKGNVGGFGQSKGKDGMIQLHQNLKIYKNIKN